MQIPANQRSRFIKRRYRIWRDLKRKMAELSHYKCWYCEIKYTRSDFDVDHFRPKIKVKDYNNPKNETEGYWWLAFDYKNFRLACSYCNSPHRCKDHVVRGKVNFFPLIEGSSRCNLGEDLSNERPLLLDPLDPLDPLLLWFYPDGRATPSYNEEENFGINKKRADTTIDILNLNAYKSVEKRRILKNRCDFLVNQGDVSIKAYEQAKRNKNQVLKVKAKRAFRKVAKQILDLVQESAELSRAAKVYLKSSDQPWLKKILEGV